MSFDLSNIRDALETAERDFLEAISSSSALDDIPTFKTKWTGIINFVENNSQTLDSSTTALAGTVGAHIEALADSYLSIENSASSVTDDLRTTMHNALKLSPTPAQRSSCPPYIQLAYSWLLDNLHNPCPAASTRSDIALRVGCQRREIDIWFSTVRARMGWTAIRSKYFRNSQRATVKAAEIAFGKNPQEPLDSNVDMAFMEMKLQAEDMYSKNFHQTKLLKNIDGRVQNLNPELLAQSREEAARQKAEERKQRKIEKEEKRREFIKLEAEERERIAMAALAYPSPDRSLSPESSALHIPKREPQEVDLADIKISRIAGQKRRLVEDDDYNTPIDYKRTRVSPIEVNALPSPVSSTSSRSLSDSPEPITPTTPTTPSSTSRTSRKRRLSESEVQGMPKRPRNIPVGTRLQAVSSPLPFTNIPTPVIPTLPRINAAFDINKLDTWFTANIGAVPPANSTYQMFDPASLNLDLSDESDPGLSSSSSTNGWSDYEDLGSDDGASPSSYTPSPSASADSPSSEDEASNQDLTIKVSELKNEEPPTPRASTLYAAMKKAAPRIAEPAIVYPIPDLTASFSPNSMAPSDVEPTVCYSYGASPYPRVSVPINKSRPPTRNKILAL